MPAVPFIAPIVGIGASAYSANQQKKAANQAQEAETVANQQSLAAQQEAIGKATGVQEQQYAAYQQMMKPYLDIGNNAMSQYQGLLGLNGAQQQQQQINQLQGGERFRALQSQGENAILQNASATGGLRGGNTQAILAQFRPQMLNDLIRQTLADYSGLATMGVNTGQDMASQALNYGNNLSNLYTGQGAATSQSALRQGEIGAAGAMARGTANSNMVSGILGGIGKIGGIMNAERLMGM